MEYIPKITIMLILISVCMVTHGNALRVTGHIEEDFETDLSYITRFVFAPATMGRFQYSIKIPANDCCSDLVAFNGWDEQWPLINAHGHEMTCYEKRDTIPGIQGTIYPLMETSTIHRCQQEVDEHGEDVIHCFGDRRFNHPHPQWYYFLFMNCHYRSYSGINATYDIHLTNGHEGALIEFAANEDTNLVVTFSCSIILIGCMLTGLFFGVKLRFRKMLHTTYKIWIVSLCLHFIGCVIMTTAWYKFSLDGFERKKNISLGHYFTSAGSIVFAILLIVISKGYTITRLTIRTIGKLKVGAFAVWFSFCYMMLYVILDQSDPRDIKNIYDTPAAMGVVGMRVGAAIWCLYGALFTMKDFPRKRSFFLMFSALTTCWFLAEPIMIIFSQFWLPLYCRAKWVHASYLIILVMGHVVFVLLTRPSATNIYFPFHLSANKVGVLEDDELDPFEYAATEATFANFLAVSKVPEKDRHFKYRVESASASSSSENQPSKGVFDLFMAGSERTKIQQQQVKLEQSNMQIPVSTISGSISMTNLVNCPLLAPLSILPLTCMMGDSVSMSPLDKGDDWKTLVMTNLEEPENNSYKNTASANVIEYPPVQPPQNSPVTVSKPKYVVSVPTAKTTALMGQNGMYGALLNESSSSSDDDGEQSMPIQKVPATFRNIKFEQPKKADTMAKSSHQKSDQKKNAVKESIEVNDLDEIHLPSASTAAAAVGQASSQLAMIPEETTEIDDQEEIYIPSAFADHRKSRASYMKHTERRASKNREVSTSDRPRPSVTIMVPADQPQNIPDQVPVVKKTTIMVPADQPQNIQDQVPAVVKTNAQRKTKKHQKSSSHYEVVDEVNEQSDFQSHRRGKHCGQTVSESQPEAAACAQPSVRRKKTHKMQSPELTIEDVIEQVHVDEATMMNDRKRRIFNMKAALKRKETEYKKKLSGSNSDSSVESVVEEETKKSKRRLVIHKARVHDASKHTSEQRC